MILPRWTTIGPDHLPATKQIGWRRSVPGAVLSVRWYAPARAWLPEVETTTRQAGEVSTDPVEAMRRAEQLAIEGFEAGLRELRQAQFAGAATYRRTA